MSEALDSPAEPLDMRRVRIDPLWALRVPSTLALRRQVLPLAEVQGSVHVACASDQDEAALAAIERALGRPVVAVRAEPESLRRAIQQLHGESQAAVVGEDAVALVGEILDAAWLRRASDVHVDPGPTAIRVRLRVDGRLEDYRPVPSRLLPELLGRIKVMAGLDIAEKRAPQDGRFTHAFGRDEQVDIRVATLPTKYGERITMRLLASARDARTLEDLGMAARDLQAFEHAIRQPHGLILATGPTGCGKTTTLYAALQRIVAASPVNAIAVEDPIEYDAPGVAQVEIDNAQKVTFARAIRSILRHDPDVIMIAEIRDAETADVAMKAALTGHLVLATLHTNSATSAVTRLDDMGVARYLTAATLRLSMAQRLARRLCQHCRQPVELTAAQAQLLGHPESEGQTVYRPGGCVYCAGKGTNGRVGLFEVLALDASWSRALAAGADEAQLVARMKETGQPTLLDDAFHKLVTGVTSLDDVLAAVAL